MLPIVTDPIQVERVSIYNRSAFEKHPLKQFMAFMDRLRSVTVLDPACGSGNFLYIALQALKDIRSGKTGDLPMCTTKG